MADSPIRIARAHIDGDECLLISRDGAVEAFTNAPPTAAVVAEWPRWRDSRGEQIDLSTITRWLAPILPDKLICVGTNYRDHVAEMAAAGVPATKREPFPYGFHKPPSSSLVGHEETVVIPDYAEQLDWEAELGVVIGDPGLIDGPDPLAGVFGYAPLNDLSVRDFVPFPHALGLDAVVCKGFHGSAPLGPWITAADAVEDVQHLNISLWVNDELKQSSSTEQMIFGVREIVRHFGRVASLQTGDVIATGTPAGVGAGRSPREQLADGDVVRVEIEALGSLVTRIAGSTYRPLPERVDA